MAENYTFEQIKAVKTRYERELLARANVVGVGIGYKQKNGQPTAELAIVVNVTQKKQPADLSEADIIPAQLDGIPTDVQEVGELKPF